MSVAVDDAIKDLIIYKEIMKFLKLGFILVWTGWLDQLIDVAESNHLLL